MNFLFTGCLNFSKDNNSFIYLHYSKIHTGIRDSVLKVYTNFSEEYFKNREKNEERYDKLFEKSEIYLKNILDADVFKKKLMSTYHIQVPIFEWEGQTYLRYSFQVYNSEDELEKLLSAVKELLS